VAARQQTAHGRWRHIVPPHSGVGSHLGTGARRSDASHPSWRARSLSVDRFWRDLGYTAGWAIAAIGALTFGSGAVVAIVMREHRPP
jgi:hypothetical protein